MFGRQQSSSRMGRYRDKRYMRQSFIMVFAGCVVLVAFFFLILPLSVRIVELVSKTKGPIVQDTTDEMVQTPELQPIVEATNSARLTIRGYVQGNNDVELFHNGTMRDTATPNSDGLFVFDGIDLQEGDNQFYAKAVTENNTESSPSVVYTVLYKTSKPTLTIESPQDGMTVTSRKEQVIAVTGKTEPDARVYLNGRLLTTGSDGEFSGSYQLAEGDNTLAFTASDRAGNSMAQELRVTYLP